MSLFVLRFYGPVNPMGSCRARSVYLTTRLLGRVSNEYHNSCFREEIRKYQSISFETSALSRALLDVLY